MIPATVEDRLSAVADAVAAQRLEGLEVDAQTIADLEEAARGAIDIDEVIRRAHQRIADGLI